MTTPSVPPPASPAGDNPPPAPPPDEASPKPWRAEGLPPRRPEKPRVRAVTVAIWVIGYLVLFGMLTLQDRLADPQAGSSLVATRSRAN
jgi:hypothetical protein